MDHQVVPIAMPGTHEAFLPFLLKKIGDKKLRILDIGAGHGAFSKRLFEQGHDVVPIDLFPEIFRYSKLTCIKADITKHVPFADENFDIAIAIEVVEHINDHEQFFSEINRVLKPNGALYISTPNILSLKSRFRFLLHGFHYSFGPLEMSNYDGLQHVSSLSIDQYNYIAIKKGFRPSVVAIDRKQKSSRWLYFIAPLQWLFLLLSKRSKVHNKKKLLFGRLLLLAYEKKPTDTA